MSKHDKSVHPLILQYLHDLSQELACIPDNDREQHISEIEGHLQSLVEEKIAKGKNTEQAAEEALKEFLPAQKLAKQIIDEAEINNINSSVSCSPSNRTEKKWLLYIWLHRYLSRNSQFIPNTIFFIAGNYVRINCKYISFAVYFVN